MRESVYCLKTGRKTRLQHLFCIGFYFFYVIFFCIIQIACSAPVCYIYKYIYVPVSQRSWPLHVLPTSFFLMSFISASIRFFYFMRHTSTCLYVNSGRCDLVSLSVKHLNRENEKENEYLNGSQDRLIKIRALLLFSVMHSFAQGPPKSSLSSKQTSLLKFALTAPVQLMNPVMDEHLSNIGSQLKSVSFIGPFQWM